MALQQDHRNPGPTRRHRQLEENQDLNHQRCPAPPPTGPLPSQKHRSPGRLPIRKQRQKVQRQKVQRQAQRGPSPRTEDGLRTGERFSTPGFRSRRDPSQNCFIPAKAVFQHGVYPRLLGNLKMAEQPPRGHGDSRLTLQNGRYHLSASTRYNPDLEQQAGREWDRVAALDPGIRTFTTWFSQTDAGHIAQGAFGRIQRLCQRLDNLISKTAKAPRTKRRNMRKAAERTRNRIRNLIKKLEFLTISTNPCTNNGIMVTAKQLPAHRPGSNWQPTPTRLTASTRGNNIEPGRKSGARI